MNKDMVQKELKKLEFNEKTVILDHFLKSQQVPGSQRKNDELSEILLDIIHFAFTSGFETAINSVISSFEEKAIE